VILYLQEIHFKYSPLHSSFTYSSKVIVGKRIKMWRKKRNMTQQQLADLIGSDRQYVWNIENGKVNLTLDYIDKIAKALQVPQSEFINTKI